jgi:predicted nucleotidyltransferase component of viral defense system
MNRMLDKNMHQKYLSLLLAEIVKTWPEKTAFKGGTCGYFFYNLPRFSFDLDFDMVQPFDDSDRDRLHEMASGHGELRDFMDKEFTLFGVFSYGRGLPHIKLELNKRVWKNNSYRTAWFRGLPLLIADEATLATNKLVALTDRKNAVARDLYDSWYFLQAGLPLHDGLIGERTGKTTVNYLKYAVAFIKKTYTRRNVLQGLGEALDERQKMWARNHLIDETVREMEKRIR